MGPAHNDDGPGLALDLQHPLRPDRGAGTKPWPQLPGSAVHPIDHLAGDRVADVWKTTPFITLILLAGLQSIPDDLYSAFRLEGGTPLQALRRVTLPLLLPYILLSLLFRLAQAFGVFDLVQVLTGGGPAGSTESIALYAYLNGMRFLDFGYSATVMLAGFLLLTALILAGTLLLRSFGLLRSLDR